MPTNNEYLRGRLLADVDYMERFGLMTLTLEEARRTRWSDQFVEGCVKPGYCYMPADFETYARNRLLLGYYRYEKPGSQMSSDNADRMSSIYRRIKSYMTSGNQEFLVDSFNLFMLEWIKPNWSNAHYPGMQWLPVYTMVAGIRRFLETKDKRWLCYCGCLILKEYDKGSWAKEAGVIPHFESIDDGEHAV